MKGSPSFQFYPADFLADESVMLMTNQEVGCYIKLLCYCWREGSIPAQAQLVAKLCGENENDMAELWEAIRIKFVSSENDPSRLINPRLFRERQKQIERSLERSASGKKGAISTQKKRETSRGSAGGSAISSAITDGQNQPVAKSGLSSSSSSSPSKIKKTLVELPTNYSLTTEHIDYAKSKGIPEHMLSDIFEGFCIHHRSKGSKFTDWYAAWQKWVRNELAYYPDKYKPGKAPEPPKTAFHYATREEILGD